MTTKTEFRNIFKQADEAGKKAAAALTPTPMVVVEHTNPLINSPVKKVYAPVMDGVCGFAWVVIYPGNSAAANYAKKNLGFRKAYEGGVSLWIGGFGQSMERKEAYAYAYSEVLQENGIKSYANSRMD
jgi:hypothetical protein